MFDFLHFDSRVFLSVGSSSLLSCRGRPLPQLQGAVAVPEEKQSLAAHVIAKDALHAAAIERLVVQLELEVWQ